MAPRLVFTFKDGGHPPKVPVVLGMLVCEDCRQGFMQRQSVREAVEKILASVSDDRARAHGFEAVGGHNVVSMDLEWIPPTDPAYKHHRGLGPS